MTENLRKRWIIVGLIWLCVLILTCWNNDKINMITSAKMREAVLERDRQFSIRNVEAISKIVKKSESAFQTIDSVRLGLLSVKNQLTSLAIQNGLSDAKMEGEPDQNDQSAIPLEFSFKGSFEGAMAWLRAFERDYPYLKARRLKILNDPSKNEAEFRISFYYRYRQNEDA